MGLLLKERIKKDVKFGLWEITEDYDTLIKELNLDKDQLAGANSVFLNFDEIQETARLFVNGIDCGILWTPPFRMEIKQFLKEGLNEISLEIVNTWNNRIVGDIRSGGTESFANTNVAYKFRDSNSLLPSGILGKASLIFIKE